MKIKRFSMFVNEYNQYNEYNTILLELIKQPFIKDVLKRAVKEDVDYFIDNYDNFDLTKRVYELKLLVDEQVYEKFIDSKKQFMQPFKEWCIKNEFDNIQIHYDIDEYNGYINYYLIYIFEKEK